jgi:maleylacetate reductase
MHSFVYTGLPSKVLFGFGTLDKVADEVRLLDCRRALVLSTPQQKVQANDLAGRLGQLCVGTFTEAAMHTPVAITEQALAVARERQADCTVALGGGSTTGLGKAIALRTDLPQIVVPTTYAGSEATPILGETERGRKTTQRTLKVLPEVIVYDVNLTLTLPGALSVTSGMNAIAHAVEALYSPDANPVISLLAVEGIAALARALPAIVSQPADRDARSDALYGAWACGASEASGCLCIISSATSLAARSISPMLKLILSCSRTRSPTMSRQRPNPWGEWRRCWLLPAPPKACSILHGA